MPIAKIVDHRQQALDRLLTQDRQRPNTKAVIGALGGLAQAFEDIAFPVLAGRLLQNAVGQQLDGIGQLVGQPRRGQTDAIYRLFLIGRIAANASDSTVNTVVQLAQTLFAAKSAQAFTAASFGHANRTAPATLGLEVGSPSLPEVLWPVAIQVMQDSFAAAVRLSYVTIFDVTQSFALSASTLGAGLDGQDATLGFARLIYSDQGA